jgi:hypothetical protein
MGLSNRYITEILTSNIPNENTRNNYIARLTKISESLEASMYDIAKDPKAYYPEIKKLYTEDSTRKNIVIAMLVIFKHIDDMLRKKKPSYDAWKEIHAGLCEAEETRYKKNKPKQSQADNYLSFDEIETKYKELKANDPHLTKKSSQEFVLLAIALYLRPKRADLGNVAIIKSHAKLSPSKNYLVLDGKTKSILVLHDFKTAKKYERIIEPIPTDLYEDIKDSLEKHPRRWLFSDRTGGSYSKNGYSQFVLRSFSHVFGKRVGVTMLRHIYVSERLDFNKMTQEELDGEAQLMGQSPDLQRKYRWVMRKGECDCECKV